MKVLTVHFPYAFGLIDGWKQYEMRSWVTQHRGPVAIHVAKQVTRQDYFQITQLARGQFPEIVARYGTDFDSHYPALGHIVGVVSLTGVYAAEKLLPETTALERAAGAGMWNKPNSYAWQVRPLGIFEEYYEVKGRLGLWNWEPPTGWKDNLYPRPPEGVAA